MTYGGGVYWEAWSSKKIDLQGEVGLAEEEGEGGGAVFDLVGLGHVQRFGDGLAVDGDHFGRFVGGLAQFDVLGEEDVADFAADAVGGVEGTNGRPILTGAANLFAQLITRCFLRGLAGLDAARGHFPTDVVNRIAVLAQEDDIPAGGDRHDPDRIDFLDDVVDAGRAVRQEELILADAVPGAGPGDFAGEGGEGFLHLR